MPRFVDYLESLQQNSNDTDITYSFRRSFNSEYSLARDMLKDYIGSNLMLRELHTKTAFTRKYLNVVFDQTLKGEVAKEYQLTKLQSTLLDTEIATHLVARQKVLENTPYQQMAQKIIESNKLRSFEELKPHVELYL